jgi:hypothetical protein
MDWAKLFADKATYPDDLKFNLNGTEVSLGDLRAHNTKTQGDTATALQARETAIAQREEKTTRATERLANIMENVAKTTGLSFDQILAGDTAAAQAAATRIREQAGREGIHANEGGELDWTKDPIYAPVDARFKPVELAMQQTQAALRAGLGVVQNDRTELAYLRFKVDNPDLAKGLKYEDAVKLAVDKGYKDEVGFPNVSQALNELAAPGISKTEKEAEYKRGIDEGRAAARAEMMGNTGLPAGSGAAGMEFVPTPDAKPGKVSSIADQLNKAMADPEMMRSGTIQ